MRIGAVGAVRVDHGVRLRQGRLALVVVGDDQPHAQLAAELRLLERRDAAVDRDDQPHALRGKLPDRPGIEAVALLEPSGDMICAIRAARAQIIRQEAGRRDAVDVIIAEHRNARAVAKRLLDRGDGAVHLPEQQRLLQRAVRPQERLGLLGRLAAARAEHTRRQRAIAAALQRRHGRRIRLSDFPSSVLQSKSHIHIPWDTAASFGSPIFSFYYIKKNGAVQYRAAGKSQIPRICFAFCLF